MAKHFLVQALTWDKNVEIASLWRREFPLFECLYPSLSIGYRIAIFISSFILQVPFQADAFINQLIFRTDIINLERLKA